ncbi:hypothetical protein EJ110_NYTH32698 [Nymphaea thermarum]|nr:hypothetical protein EJ110_NYTH32698 [Nymphaea thermarum]
MFGGGHPGKFGARGGGRAGGGTAPKRPGMVPHHHMSSSSFPTPPQPPVRSSSRPPSSAGGNNGGHPAPAADETFRLETSSPLNFGMLIRLAPDLVDEIKRVQAQGLNAKIKFDNNPNNSSGNVIDVGGKEFRFTWSREPGDPSDIYEEHRSGVNGNGLLVESGSAWRKLNVQRVLDESTRGHVKMRSEEAERLQKSRKAIILDHGNPSVKNHVRTLATAPPEVATTVTTPSKPVQKLPVTSVGSAGKTRTSVSPVPSPIANATIPLQTPTSPTGNVSNVRGSKLADDVSGSRMAGSSNGASNEKDLSGRFGPASLHENVKGGIGSTQMDLRSFLISLLTENPKGMTVKALEKAVAEAIPNHGKKLETTIRTIANYLAPGRYVLKEDVEKEVTKRSSLESGRSPICPSGAGTGGSNFIEKIAPEEIRQLPGLEPESTEPIDFKDTEAHQELIDVFDDNQNIITEEEKVCSSSSESGSESDSESDSSDSGSISRSKSRSPVSASSSDSESDGSSSSQEGSDVHVDIMDDDDDGNDEGLHRFQGPDSRLSSSPFACRKSDNDYEQDEQHGFSSQLPTSPLNLEEVGTHDGVVNIIQPASLSPTSERMKESSEDKVEIVSKEVSVLNVTNDNHLEELVPIASNNRESKLNKKECGESVNANITLKISERGTKDGKETRGTFGTTPEKPEMDEVVPVSSSRTRADVVHSQDYALNAKREEGLKAEGRTLPSSNWKGRDASYALGPRFSSPERLMEDFTAHPSGNLDNNSEKAVELVTKSKYSNLQQKKHSEQSRKPTKEEKFRATPHQSNTNDGKNAVITENKGKLRREYSDLEIGEFREPIFNEDSQDHKKQLERKSSFGRTEKIDSTENTYVDPGYQKKRKKGAVDSTKPSPQFSDPGGQGFVVSQSGTKLPEMNSLNQTKQQNVSGALHLSMTDLVDVDSSSQLGRSSYTKTGKSDAKASHKVLLPGDHGNSEKRNSANVVHPQDTKVPRTSVGIKPKKSNLLSDSVSSKLDISQKENRICGKKRTYVSTDEQFPYAIYDKDKPELREAIQTDSQYKEYTREYCEKYSCYCSLNKTLEDDRTHFQKLGCDLELAKDRDKDTYDNALGQLRRAYQQCAERHRQMKKIFIVLHEELKHLKKRIKDYAAVYTRESSLK